MEEPKRRLKIDLSELELAFQHNEGASYYLDLETGEVTMVTDEDRDIWEELDESCRDPESHAIDWAKAKEAVGYDIQDWQQESVEKLDQVEKGFGERYITVPQLPSSEGFNDMVDFIDTLSNPYLKTKLERALQGKGVFRRFKDVLLEYPIERQRWFDFKDERQRERILEWLDEEGIELIEEDDEEPRE